jgi:tRNA(fMet)-specific endonuclease VapC
VTRLLLDTTFLIDAERGAAHLDRLIADDDDVAVAAITIAELRVGAMLADRRRKPARSAYVESILGTVPVLGYDLEAAEAHASLLVEVRTQGRPRGAHDLMIAATAKASNRTVLTADPRAFLELNGVDVQSHR